MDDDRLPSNPRGTVITRFNYNRPKWFGGFFGEPSKHNTSGNCVYDKDAMARVISPEDLNKLVEPMYLITPIFAYHLAITIFLALSVLLTFLQQGFNLLIEFAFITSLDQNNYYLRTLGIIWYCVWGIGLFTIVPLYYVSVHHVERYFRDSQGPIFTELRVKAIVNKSAPNKFLLIDGFKKLDSIEIVQA
jgi:hypothetical protein